MDHKYFINLILYMLLIVVLLGLISQHIWNAVISDIFSIRQITLIESILINLLLRIYFQNFNFEDKD
jgi:hypothetical protein